MDGEKTCETCRHFRRHYVKRGRNWYIPIKLGHCGEPRIRYKQTDTPACHRYSEAQKKGGGMFSRPFFRRCPWPGGGSL